ncbi:hypothetical protein M9458_039379 [Cirrhinus mrigala]|uniref:Uncharacterized protein n=1 Tax=Cirrhinus mrigala TaxID=683832 RepID=A0ABD0NRP5_CIRMR
MAAPERSAGGLTLEPSLAEFAPVSGELRPVKVSAIGGLCLGPPGVDRLGSGGVRLPEFGGPFEMLN